MRLLRIVAVVVVGAFGLCLLLAAAEPAPIEGRWITFDGDTNQKRAVIEIVRVDRWATGRVVELFLKPDENPDPVCEKCRGEAHGQRIRGLDILAVEVDDNGASYRGTVLDPEEGASYRCVVTILPGGTRLRLHGFIGLEAFGRDEIWFRVE